MRPHYFGIKIKLIVAFIFVAVAISVIFTLISLKREREHIHNEMVKRGRDVTGIFTQMTTPLMFSMDYIAILDNGKELIKNNDILSVVVTDEKGRVLVSTDMDISMFVPLDFFNKQVIKNRRLQYRDVNSQGKTSLEFVSPVIIMGDVEGLVIIRYSQDSMIKKLQESKYNIIYHFIWVMVLAIVLAIVLSRVFNSIKVLVNGANEIANGNLDFNIPEHYHDEIGEFARSFNSMRRNLKKNFERLNNQAEEIKTLNDELEERVKERTEQLQQEIIERKNFENALKETNDKLEQMVEDRTAKLRVINTDLVKAKKESESANRLKSEFIANVSHEIRTPLNAILGFSQIISDKTSDLSQKKNLSYVINSGKALLSMINDILELSKIEAGLISPTYESFPVRPFIYELMQLFSPSLNEKELEMLIEIAPDTSEYVTLDKVRLRQVLVNLIGNSVKFTHKGHIKLSVYPDKAKPNSLIFSVEDSGIGIPDDKLSEIFDAFNQLSKKTEEFPGLGLGLAVSRRLVKMMKGELVVKSEVGKGSVFKVVLEDVEVVSGHGIKEQSAETFPPAPEKGEPLSICNHHIIDKELQEILINEVKRCEELTKSMSIDSIEAFSREMKELGIKYNFSPLVKWAEELLLASGSFDVEKIHTYLKAFIAYEDLDRVD